MYTVFAKNAVPQNKCVLVLHVRLLQSLFLEYGRVYFGLFFDLGFVVFVGCAHKGQVFSSCR